MKTTISALVVAVLVSTNSYGGVLREGAVACHTPEALELQVQELVSERDPRLVEDCVYAEGELGINVEVSPLVSAVVFTEPMTGWTLYTLPQYVE